MTLTTEFYNKYDYCFEHQALPFFSFSDTLFETWILFLCGVIERRPNTQLAASKATLIFILLSHNRSSVHLSNTH